MANYATGNIRTVALVGQGGAGKTTLAEALLLKSGMIKEAGASSAARRSPTSIRSKSPGSIRCARRSCTSTRRTRGST